jgi:hypothetical protein
MADAVKVAASLYQWSAAMRNRDYYGEKRDIRLEMTTPDLAEKLRRARHREMPDQPAAPAADDLTPEAPADTRSVH